MAEESNRVRNKAIEDTTQAEVRYARSGQLLAFVLATVSFAAAIAFFASGENYAATVLVGVPALMLVRAFASDSRSAERHSNESTG